jgi:hypothetical protein
MDQVGSWVAHVAALFFGLVAWAITYWSLPVVLLIVPVLVLVAVGVGLFLQSPR